MNCIKIDLFLLFALPPPGFLKLQYVFRTVRNEIISAAVNTSEKKDG